MDIQFIEKEAIPLVGMSFFGDPFREAGDWSMDNEIGRLSRRYMDYRHKNRDLLESIITSEEFYETHIYTPESIEKGFFEIFVGQEMRIDELASVPLELSIKLLPSNQYASFNLVGEQIFSDWYRDIDKMLKQAGWQRGGHYFFQVYDKRFKGMDRIAESELNAYIPVAQIKS
jgi:predicted transcriptional regulator YdeE